jgi:uncharacterized delta-60 repeat protein
LGLAFLLSVGLAKAQTVDQFNPSPGDGSVSAIGLEPDNDVVIGGLFRTLGGQSKVGIGRVKTAGTLDASYNSAGTNYAGFTYACGILVQTDGKVLVGGIFTNLAGRPCAGLGRLLPNGTLDPAFTGGVDGNVRALATQSDGKIIVAGQFGALGGQPRTNLARLNLDGSLDQTFAAAAEGGNVFSVAVQPDDKILVCGIFTNLAGLACTNIGRLNRDGSSDGTFHATASPWAGCMLPQPDGRIIVGGAFTNLNQQPCNYLGRLNPDGTWDPSFNPNPDATVYSLTSQADGRILVAGGFTNIGGYLRPCLARLNSDGTLDTNFNAGPFTLSPPTYKAIVTHAHLQSDGAVLVSGVFLYLAGEPRTSIGRFTNTDPASQRLVVADSTISWLRGGTSPEVLRTSFDTSTDGTNWVSLGPGTRIDGGWQLTGVSIPVGATVRARGFVLEVGCSWFFETFSRPSIVVDDEAFGVQSNSFGFNVTGSAGQKLIVTASTDLVSWTPLLTNTLGLGPCHFSDPLSLDRPARFYRATFE